ncbi:S1 family peptidase [Variovorax saccharolyticus]|uniref:S1 family peptidase n=1 Tax=Variovorax saccharolyticus TaxID=3053516 RepID=UPI002576FC92|nr:MULTISPECIES: serine protease [unclassified Variovorax]MDM0020503.1 serine protease [Variovorax sp. J22R187]MDM0025957.1 serine protease [Variovorax sp. J31P216]
MTLACIVRTAAFLAGAFVASGAFALEPDLLFARVSPAVWTVRALDAQERLLRTGSAVVVAPGRLVTACHVLAKAASFVIRQDNVTYGATLEHPDVERDLCQIRVANFHVAPVPLASPGTARVGQKAYLVGSPRGVENTLGETMLTGLRGEDGDDRQLQLAAVLAAGASGGGLFDAEGRLLGITSAAGRDPGAPAFAVPADFVPEIAARAQAALAQRPRGDARTAAPGSTPAAVANALTAPLRPGDGLEFQRIDRLTGNRSTVIYRVDRVTGDEVIFNMGGRVEKTDGRVVSVASPVGGSYDVSSPPGGWGRKDLKPGMRWHLDYVTATGDKWRHELDATVVAERTMRVDGLDLNVVQIDYSGWIYASYGTGASAVGTPFRASTWYARDLGRVVRFEAEHRRGNASSSNESLELVRVLR